ncbi:MAG: FAD-dependent oxidoreductase [Armatimonadetes bacterium]|nr:FAD-dependent oxidoreductase [Armatimonadota bacterium]
MAKRDTVLVIGGGVIGVCSAWYLAEQGREVVLLDKGELCSGASYGNAGFILPSHSVPLASPGALGSGLRWMFDPESPFYIKPRMNLELLSWLWRFTRSCNESSVRRAVPLLRDLQRASLRLYEGFAARAELAFGFERKGMLMLYRTPQGYEGGIREARLLGEYGIEFRTLDNSGVREMEPQILPEVVGGVYYAEDAHLDPRGFVTNLARLAGEKGVDLRPQTEVLWIEADGNRISHVRTTRGDFQPDEVVLAGGAWSPTLAGNLDLSLPIQAAKGYSITVKRPPLCPTIPMLLGETRVAVTPLGDRLRLAGTLELAGLDLSINRRRVEAILKGARAFLGGLVDVDLIEIWRGLRPCTPDGLPILGRTQRYENLLVASGHAMIGQSLGPITGKLISQIVCRQEPEVDLTPLRVERFAQEQ